MDTKLLFVDSGAAAVQLSTELRGKDYFRSNFGNLVERFQSSNHMGCSKRPHLVDGRPKKGLSGFMESVV
jgi:hypothetical protein